jgi:hypothetical protein
LTCPAAAIASDVTTSVVPTVESSLVHIAIAINSTVLTVVPAVTGTAVPLAIEEVEALIAALGDIHTIVSSIETTLMSTVKAVTAGELLLSSYRKETMLIFLPRCIDFDQA